MNKEIIEQEIMDFMTSFCPFGYLDIKAGIKTCKEYDIPINEWIEAIEEYKENYELILYNKLDPNYVLYDYILQKVRNLIEENIGLDIQNDLNTGEIEIIGNYLCTSWDYSIETKEELITKLKESGKLPILCCNKTIATWLEDTELLDTDNITVNKEKGRDLIQEYEGGTTE